MNDLLKGYLFILPIFSGILTLILFLSNNFIFSIHSLLITISILYIKKELEGVEK